jgi:uncharacterized sulfatase
VNTPSGWRAAGAVVAALLYLGPAKAEKPRYNLVAVVTDDQGRWAVGAYGNKECRTPHMDRLAREGAKFLNAFVPTPVCSPSRAAYLTGRYATEVGITDFIDADEARRGVGLSTKFATWPKALQEAGYRTGLIGKWHLGTKAAFHPGKHGLGQFAGSLRGSFQPLNPSWEVGGKEVVVKGHSADVTGDAALRFLDDVKGKPFALLVHFREPHLPYTPVSAADAAVFKDLDPTVPKGRGLDEKQLKQWHRDYYAAVHAVDRNFGRILAKLESLKRLDTTIVTFTSDHGYNIGHHGIHTKGNGHWVAGGARGPKRPNMWDTSLRVPLLVRWPGVVRGPTEVREVVSNLDMYPSVLGMLGVAAPKGAKHHGLDFSALLRGKKPAWREELYGTYDLHNGGLAYMRMVRTERWKLVRHHKANGLDELYDLANDPGEEKNLYAAAKHAKARDELQGKLTKWMKSIDDPLRKGDR